jgi:hypothetical protein
MFRRPSAHLSSAGKITGPRFDRSTGVGRKFGRVPRLKIIDAPLMLPSSGEADHSSRRTIVSNLGKRRQEERKLADEK